MIKSLVLLMLFKLFLICLVSSVPLSASSSNDDDADGCIRRYFDQNSFVCVCNLTSCPSIKSASRVPEGYVHSWESSLDRHRFHFTSSLVEDLKKNIAVQIISNYKLVQVDLNLNDRRQTIHGFGGAVTDASGINLASLPMALADRILADYFSKEGLDYSAARVPIGGTDFSTRVYTYDDGHDDDFNLDYFALQPEDLMYKIPIIKKALELKDGEPIKLLGSAWSPPAWMKTNDRIDGSGFLKGTPGGPYYKAWANYYVKFLDSYAKEGINFWGITTGNEPTNALRQKEFFFNCLGMTPETLRDFVKLDLGPTLAKSGYGVDKFEVLMHDDIRDFLPNYTETVLSDKEAASYVTGIGFHWYKNGAEDFYENLERAHKNFENHFLFATEASEGFARFSTKRAQLGNWTRAETYAIDIIEGLNRHTTGWLDWNLVLNTGGGPSWAENWTDGLILVDANTTTYYRNPMFYSLGHFSKFIPPGSVYIGHEMHGDTEGVLLASFVDPTKQMIMVVINTNDDPVDVIVNNFTSESITVAMDAHSIKTVITPSS